MNVEDSADARWRRVNVDGRSRLEKSETTRNDGRNSLASATVSTIVSDRSKPNSVDFVGTPMEMWIVATDYENRNAECTSLE